MGKAAGWYAVMGLMFFLPVCARAGQLQRIDASHCPSSGLGTILFTVTPLKDDPSEYGHEMLFQAGSSDGTEFYEFQVVGTDLLVVRDFGQCIRSVNRSRHDFKPGQQYRLMLSWHGPTTRLFINDREIKGFNMLPRGDSAKYVQSGKAGDTDAFTVNNVAITPLNNIPIDPGDRVSAESFHCPQLSQLKDERPQEEYRGIYLHHFPDRQSRDTVKSYIDILPVSAIGYLKHIIFVDAAEQMTGAQGLTTSRDTFYVKAGSEPTTFFHEATHISDINANWALSKKWEDTFMRNDRPRRGTSVMGSLDGSSAPEQLADFAGQAYGFYLTKRGSGSLKSAFGPDAGAKLDFLFYNGLVTRQVYDSLTRR